MEMLLRDREGAAAMGARCDEDGGENINDIAKSIVHPPPPYGASQGAHVGEIHVGGRLSSID
jgi:hypothetical protein